MKDFFADLHCHTICSDGSLSPEEIVLLAKESGLSALSITDHDSITAYQMALPAAQKENISLLTGVEFSTMHNKTSIHILGYAFAPDSSVIAEFCKKHTLRRKNRNDKILKLLQEIGLPITEEELLAETTLAHTIGRPHIAQAMIKKGYVTSIQEAFKKYLGDHKSCYAEGASYSTVETIELIHQAKGLAVIAHPHLIDDAKILQELLKMDFDGIECYYGRFHQNHNERFLKIAKKKNWLITGGSDFHGSIKPNLPLGASFVNEEHCNKLLSHFQNNLK
ncbi:MAG TPA: PHP domain-containing protein [Parachlamydiaceae bacterium]|nr:PHP domain-containing protein [Parachlamydiaceae bacterium]